MNPWQNIWAPNLHLPWSGNVSQQIEPEMTWFFDGIKASSGDASTERQIFEIASYGKQIGWISEVVLAMTELPGNSAVQQHPSCEKLKHLATEVLRIKHVENASMGHDMEKDLLWLKTHDHTEYSLVAQKLRAILEQKDLQTPTQSADTCS